MFYANFQRVLLAITYTWIISFYRAANVLIHKRMRLNAINKRHKSAGILATRQYGIFTFNSKSELFNSTKQLSR